MRVLTALISVLIISLSIINLVSGEELDKDTLFSHYDYDRHQPLEATEALIYETALFQEYKITYHSVNDEIVPALLTIPRKGQKPYPVILFLHGHGGSKGDIADFIEPMSNYGYAIASYDAQYHGERAQFGKEIYSTDLEADKEAIIQTIIDGRRAIDYLETREDIDSERIAMVGGSMGAILGCVLAGVDDRIKVPILVVGGGDMPLMIETSEMSEMRVIRESLDLSYEELREMTEEIDPINFVKYISPRPLQMHNGLHDKIVPTESNRLLFEAAKEPKKIYWYDAGHDLPLEYVFVRVLMWLQRYL